MIKESKKAYDAVVIPGGGLTPDGELPLWVKVRFEKALEIRERVKYFLLLSGGTVHKPPPTDHRGFPVFESRAGAHYLLEREVDPANILTEISSYDTIGNAFFSRVIHAQPAGLRNLLIITSQFHLPRVQTVFRWIYQLKPLPYPYRLEFLGTPNSGLEKEPLRLRKQRESASLANLKSISAAITTLPQLHNWIFSEHRAYNCSADREHIQGKLLNTY